MFFTTRTGIFLIMLVLHILIDFHLQGWLSQSKQKDYWLTIFPNMEDKKDKSNMYRNDYKCCLLVHSLFWTFMIMLPAFICSTTRVSILIVVYIINTILHYIIDDLKANEKTINLIDDQIVHVVQLLFTLILCF